MTPFRLSLFLRLQHVRVEIALQPPAAAALRQPRRSRLGGHRSGHSLVEQKRVKTAIIRISVAEANTKDVMVLILDMTKTEL